MDGKKYIYSISSLDLEIPTSYKSKFDSQPERCADSSRNPRHGAEPGGGKRSRSWSRSEQCITLTKMFRPLSRDKSNQKEKKYIKIS
jgi:hypothetical protein